MIILALVMPGAALIVAVTFASCWLSERSDSQKTNARNPLEPNAREDGDFANVKRTIHAAFVAGNATGAAYRVLVMAGEYAEGAFTRNGNDEPNQLVAVIGWGGALRY
ncbi:hypothetical protein LCGC14_1950080 [marine sediment metagenome]|uniref:Uncharacterized protein n=1 Tax=marine sediment metagenome TaxID=412755 RepID=A0A0F9HW52_9ZZZZ